MHFHVATALLAAAASAVVQCPSPTTAGCAMPTGAAWEPRWAMRSSLYMYCFEACMLDFFSQHKELGVYNGIVAFDHYWTKQGSE